MKKNYHYSGKSTPEAIEDFKTHFLSQLPRPIKWLAEKGIIPIALIVICDGCGVRGRIDGGAILLPTDRDDVKRWRDTEWTHRARLDFCERCSADGTADRAVADGAKPLGTYTFEAEGGK